MKKGLLILVYSSVLLLSSCNGWFFQPNRYNPPTPFRPPTRTPSIVTATPASAATATPAAITATMAADTPAVVITDTPPAPPSTDPITPEPTFTNPFPALSVQILGCNTSIDILHGLGEVTNAYVLLKNPGPMELTNLKVTLYALDEGQAHPNKTVEVASLPASYQVTVKLTVDSTYRADTPVQVEVLGDGGLFQRLGADACSDPGLAGPAPESLNTPVPY